MHLKRRLVAAALRNNSWSHATSYLHSDGMHTCPNPS